MTSLEEYFGQVADVDDFDVATDKVLDLIGKNWRTVLHGAVRDQLVFHRRYQVRTIERQAPKSNAESDPGTEAAEVPSLNLLRAELLASSFSVDGKKPRVLWGEATVADHEARIEYLTKHVTGLQRTIGRHEEAVALIRSKRRAKCLNDLLPKTHQGDAA